MKTSNSLSALLGLALCAPALIAFEGAHAAEALITNQLSDSVSVIDLGALTSVADIKIGGKPAGIALSPDKTIAYVTAPDGKELVEVDAVTRTVKRRLNTGGGPLGVAAHPQKPEVYVADWYAHKIAIVDAQSMTVAAEIPVGQSPSGLAVTPDGALLVSADRDSNQVSIIDLASRKVVATVVTGERPFGVTIDAAGKLVYTANVASNDVTVIDLASRKAVATVKTGRRPYAVALAAGKGFSTDQGSGTISVFDLTDGKALKSIAACDHPEGIETADNESTIYVACWGDNIVLKIDAKSLQILAKIATGDGPRAFGKFLR